MKTKQYKLNIPPDTRDMIKAEAADNHRSMNAEIIHRLEQTFKAEEKAEIPDKNCWGAERK